MNMTDIVGRLRAKRVRGRPGFYNPDELCQEAATEIERLRSNIGEQCAKLRDHLSQALRQWQMYAELERDRDLKSEQSHEGELFRELLAALTAPPGDKCERCGSESCDRSADNYLACADCGHVQPARTDGE